MKTLQKMRVMQVIGSLHLGGAERVVAHLARQLSRDDFDISVRCTKEMGVIADELKADGLDVQLVAPARRSLRHFTPAMLWRSVLAWRPDIVHTHGGPALLHAGLLAPIGLLPSWIHTFHFGNYSAELTRQMRAEKRLCRNTTHNIAVSERQREALIRFFNVAPASITTIGNGVQPNPFMGSDDSRRHKRAELGLRPEEFVIGCVAVLSEQKGVTYLLKAMRGVLDRQPSARLVIVGGGPLEASLRAEASALGLGERALFTGWRVDSQALLHAFDVFIMPSLWEAMSMVLLEAMAAGLAIVATDVGENRSSLDDGRCGVVIPARDPDAIETAVVGLMLHPGRAREMAALALNRFSDHYTVSHMVEAHARFYRRQLA